MKNKKSIISLILIVLGLGLVFFLKNKLSNQEVDLSPVLPADEISSQNKNATSSPDDNKIKEINQNETPTESSIAITEKFDSLLSSIDKDVKKCQKELQEIFPEKYIEDDKLPYNSVKDIKKAITSFYNVVRSKSNKTHEIISFFEKTDSQSLDPKKTFQKLSNVPDCGDFEEELIMDALITYVSEHSFSKSEKKSISLHLLKEFDKQLNEKVSLHHLVSKLDSIESLIDEDIIPDELQEDLEKVNQVLEDSEQDFRNLLPNDFRKKQFLTPKEIVELKKREDEIINRLKVPTKEFINQSIRSIQ